MGVRPSGGSRRCGLQTGGTTAKANRAARGVRSRALRRTLERLGPTFVKFGQLLRTRVDLFGAEFIAELSQLHSHVPPFPTAEARAILEDWGRVCPVDTAG